MRTQTCLTSPSRQKQLGELTQRVTEVYIPQNQHRGIVARLIPFCKLT